MSKNKILAMLLMVTTMVVMSGCGNKVTSEEPTPTIINEEKSTTVAKEVVEYEEFTWPESDISALLPIPESNKGEVVWETSIGLSVDVSNTSQEDYESYIDACKSNGFDIDAFKGTVTYVACNEDGYSLNIQYKEDEQLMHILIVTPSEN